MQKRCGSGGASHHHMNHIVVIPLGFLLGSYSTLNNKQDQPGMHG